jgi:hypothetical protein
VGAPEREARGREAVSQPAAGAWRRCRRGVAAVVAVGTVLNDRRVCAWMYAAIDIGGGGTVSEHMRPCMSISVCVWGGGGV